MYYEKREYVGEKIYVTKTCNSGNINAHGLSGRTKATKEMREAQRKYNEKMRIKKLYFLLQLNFSGGDLNITLHYPRGLCPDDEHSANRNVSAMLRELRKSHRNMRYIYCTHTSERGSIHHHLIITKDVPLIDIEEAWAAVITDAKISVGRCLYRDKTTYKKLAAYLIADDKHEPHSKGGRAFTGSLNLTKPEVERREIKARTWALIPRAPRGYRVESCVNTKDIYGAPYQYYILVPEDDPLREDAGDDS